jgi:glyoxylase-like metal-dependent hydrolase (beta-lactamase superfamily II)
MRISVLALTLTCACRNAPIDDGASFGRFTQVKTFFTSVFVAETPDGVLLVDSGFSKGARPIQTFLESRDLSLSDVTDVILTHGHTDHVRGLDNFPRARIWAHEAELAHIKEEAADGTRVTDTVVDGDRVWFGDLEVEFLRVPGHTAGNLTLLADDILLLGDTAMSFKDGTVGPPPERYSDHPQRAETELLALRDRLYERSTPLEAIVFAHSEGLYDPSPFWNMQP